MSQSDLLSQEEFLAGLGESVPSKERRSKRRKPKSSSSKVLSEDEFLAWLEPITLPEQKPPTPSEGLAGGLLGGVGNLLKGASVGFSAAGRNLEPGSKNAKDRIFLPAGEALQGKADAIYPPEVQGQAGLGTRVAHMAGNLAPGLAADVLNPAAGALTFALQFGAPAYYEVKRETGDEGKAIKAFVGEAAIAQLNLLGFGGKLPGILRKVEKANKASGGALTRLDVLRQIAGQTAKGHAAMTAQAGLSAALNEHLTDKDRDVIEEMWQTFTSPEGAIIAGGLSTLKGAVDLHRSSKVSEKLKEAGKQKEVPQATLDEIAAIRLPKELQEPAKAPGYTEQPGDVEYALRATDEALRSAGQRGVPKPREKPAETAIPAKGELVRKLETIGKATGASEAEIEQAKGTLMAVPKELDHVEEFHKQAARLRKGGQKTPKAEPTKTEPEVEPWKNMLSGDAKYDEALESYDLDLILAKEIASWPNIHKWADSRARADAELSAGDKSDVAASRANEWAKHIRRGQEGKIPKRPEGLPQSEAPKPRAAPEVATPIPADLTPPKQASASTKHEEPLLAPGLEEKAARKEGISGKALVPAEKPKAPKPQATLEEISLGKPVRSAEPDETTIQLYAGLPPLHVGAQASDPGKIKRGAKALFEGLLKTHGAKPEEAALLEERAKGEVELAASRTRSAVLATQRAIKRHNRTSETKITNGDLLEALKDPSKLAALPESIRPQIEKMRAMSDDLSRTMVDEGMTSQTMGEVIKSRMGEYLRTAYKAHQDLAWAKKVPKAVRNRLESLLVSWAEPLTPDIKKRLYSEAYGPGRKAVVSERRALRKQIDSLRAQAKTDPIARAQMEALGKQRRGLKRKLPPQTMKERQALFELRGRKRLQGKSLDDIKAEMSAMLQDAKRVAENPWAAFAKANLKRKDVSLFKARKGLPEEMKAFLGEEKDPYVNYTNTILKQASFVAAHRKFVKMRDAGLGKWLHEKPTSRNGVEYTTAISAADNPRLSPLVGDKKLYTTEAIKKALFDADTSLANPLWRKIVVTNAVLKGTKTVYQAWAVPKQAIEQISTLVRTGHYTTALSSPRKIIEGMWGIGEGKALHEDLIRLRVLDESLAAAEFRDIGEVMQGKQLNKPYRAIAKGNKFLAGAFSQPDNFSKTAGYLQELKYLKKLGHPEEVAKQMAADRVRNLYPTYSRIAKWIQTFRRQPLIGTFVAFKAEQARTRFENLKLIAKEFKSENPIERAMAIKRAGHMIAALSLAPAGKYAWNMLNGVDQEEDERRRQWVGDWYDERNLVWVDDGKRFIDISGVDEGSWITDPLMRILEGADIADVLKESYNENIEPFASLSIFSEVAVDVIRGRNKYGREFKDVEERMKYLFENITPSSWRDLNLSDLTGLRVRETRKKKTKK